MVADPFPDASDGRLHTPQGTKGLTGSRHSTKPLSQLGFLASQSLVTAFYTYPELTPARLPVRAAHPGPEAPPALQLRQARRLPGAGTDGRTSGSPEIAGRINVALIRAHWSEILRIIASIRTGTVTASLIMCQLVSYPRQNGVAAALRELGRLERTLFTLDWIDDPELRRATGQELNKGETRNSLARAVFLHRFGEIRDRTYENQQHRASGLNLLVTAIILWNTRYLEHAVAALRQVEEVPDHLLAHLSPLEWEHVNLTGDYIWAAHHNMSENIEGMKPLRLSPDTFAKAA